MSLSAPGPTLRRQTSDARKLRGGGMVFAAMAACAAIGLPLLTDRALGRSRGNA